MPNFAPPSSAYLTGQLQQYQQQGANPYTMPGAPTGAATGPMPDRQFSGTGGTMAPPTGIPNAANPNYARDMAIMNSPGGIQGDVAARWAAYQQGQGASAVPESGTPPGGYGPRPGYAERVGGGTGGGYPTQGGQTQYGYGTSPNSSNRGVYEQQTPAGSFASADQQRSNAYGANANTANNSYIGATAQGINGANSVMGYAERAQYNNPYLGRSSERAADAGRNAYAGANPYLDNAIGASAADMQKNFNQTIMPQIDRMAQQSGSYGNSGVAQVQQDAFQNLGRDIGTMSSGMRMQDYGMQQGLAESALNRTTGNNQFNSTLSANDLGRNLAGGYQQNGQNNGYFMDAAMFDAGNTQRTQEFNSTLGEADLSRNSTLAQGQGQFNAGSLNTNSMFNAGARNTNSMFNAGQGNNINSFNAGSANTMLEGGRNRAENARQFDVADTGTNRRFDATLGENSRQFDTTTSNQVDQFGRTLDSNNRQFDATLGQRANEFNDTMDFNVWTGNNANMRNGTLDSFNMLDKMVGWQNNGIDAATGIQNTDLNYYDQFVKDGTQLAGMGTTQTQEMPGDRVAGAIGGATIGNSYNNYVNGKTYRDPQGNLRDASGNIIPG